MATEHRPVTWGKRILLFLLLVFIVIQLVPRGRWDKEVTADRTLAGLTQPPAQVAKLLEVACYDCHAYGTEYPWYSNVAPISFWIDHHVEEGREHLNFSEWASYSARKQRHKLEECAEEVEEGEMPMDSYLDALRSSADPGAAKHACRMVQDANAVYSFGRRD